MRMFVRFACAAAFATLPSLGRAQDAPAAAPAAPATEAKPAEAPPAEAKPAEAKAEEAKPAEAKPVEAKPDETKPDEAPKAKTPDELHKEMQGAFLAANKAEGGVKEKVKVLVSFIANTAEPLMAHPDSSAVQKEEARKFKLNTLMIAANNVPDEYGAACKAYCAEVFAAEPESALGQLAAVQPFLIDLRGETPPPDAVAKLTELTQAYPKSALLPSAYVILSSHLKKEGKLAEATAILNQGVEALTAAGRERETSSLKSVIMRIGMIGKPVEFSGPTVAGETLDVASLKGKVVLVDFWATWCGPCIAELPNVKAAYEKYREQGFEIVGVSLDREEDALKEFIAKENMPWPQIFSKEEGDAGWSAPIAKKFEVHAIPTMFLLDREGNFITDDLRGEGVLVDAIEKALKAAPAAATPAPAAP